MMSGMMPACSSAFRTPTCAAPRAPPLESASPILFSFKLAHLRHPSVKAKFGQLGRMRGWGAR